MKTLKLSLLAASKPMTGWLDALQRRGSPSAGESRPARANPGQPLERYAATVFQSLALFRFFSFGLGIVLVFTLHPYLRPSLVPILVPAVVVVGLYNIGRVLWRPNPARGRLLVDMASVGSDLVLSVGLVLLTGGLDSGFLVYSLAPILAAGLLIDARTAATAGAISALSVLGAYVARGLGLGGFPGILSGNYLTLSLLYAAICLMTGVLPFLTNLNWHRRMRALENSEAPITRG